MIPTDFPQAGGVHVAPEGMDESHVATVRSFTGHVHGGCHDGQKIVVVAWQPTPGELAQLNAGAPVFLTMFGGLVPHCLTTSFGAATTIQ